MLEIKEQEVVCILDCFKAFSDPRCTTNRLHLLRDVIVIAVCGVLANADGPLAIAKWAQLNSTWLKKHLQLPNGIPSRDTIRRVLTLLDPTAFQQCFTVWLDSLPHSRTHIRTKHVMASSYHPEPNQAASWQGQLYIMKRRMAGWNVDYMLQILTGQST